MTLVRRAFDAGESLLLNIPDALPCNAVDAREFAHASKRALLDELSSPHRSDVDDAIQLSSRCTVDVDTAASVYRNENPKNGYKHKGNEPSALQHATQPFAHS